MPSHSFVAYDPAAIAISDGTLTLSAMFNTATDRTTIAIEDNANAPETGNDLRYFHADASARIHAAMRYVLANETEITRIESGGTLLGYIENDPALEPGMSYAITRTADTRPTVAHTLFEDVPGFVAGTRILTPAGEVAVEHLQPGDRVITLDHGAQKVRRVTQRTVLARGAFLPVEFKPGALANDRPLLVSQRHRMLLSNPLSELYFGSHQVFARALHLVNQDDVVAANHFKLVTYCHFVFDDHEIVFANGARAESLFLGDVDKAGKTPRVPGRHSQTARITLRHHETRMIAGMRAQPESEIAAAMCANRLAV